MIKSVAKNPVDYLILIGYFCSPQNAGEIERSFKSKNPQVNFVRLADLKTKHADGPVPLPPKNSIIFATSNHEYTSTHWITSIASQSIQEVRIRGNYFRADLDQCLNLISQHDFSQCSCSSRNLMFYGCTCGYFKKDSV